MSESRPDKPPRGALSLLVLLGVLALITVVMVIVFPPEGRRSHTAPEAAPGAPSAPPGPGRIEDYPLPIVDVSMPPAERFSNNCASCHGPAGMYYPPVFAQRNPVELRSWTKQMVTQYLTSLPTAEIEELIAYQTSIQTSRPFFSPRNTGSVLAGRAAKLEFEAVGILSLKVETTSGTVEAVAREGFWEADLGGGRPILAVGEGVSNTRVERRWNTPADATPRAYEGGHQRVPTH